MRKYLNNNKGFTLIEVLVASVILFSSIATVSMIYRGAYLSSDQANQHIITQAALPSILANVRNDIRAQNSNEQKELIGEGNSWNTAYKWKATLILFKSAPEKLDPDSSDSVVPPLKYKLWDVTLILKTDEMEKNYKYKELSWNNA